MRLSNVPSAHSDCTDRKRHHNPDPPAIPGQTSACLRSWRLQTQTCSGLDPDPRSAKSKFPSARVRAAGLPKMCWHGRGATSLSEMEPIGRGMPFRKRCSNQAGLTLNPPGVW